MISALANAPWISPLPLFLTRFSKTRGKAVGGFSSPVAENLQVRVAGDRS